MIIGCSFFSISSVLAANADMRGNWSMNGTYGSSSMTITERFATELGDQQYKGKFYEAGMEATISIFFNAGGTYGQYSDWFRIISTYTDTTKAPPSSRWNWNNAHWNPGNTWQWECKLINADSFSCTSDQFNKGAKMNGNRNKY
jgi:hypothetical protein